MVGIFLIIFLDHDGDLSLNSTKMHVDFDLDRIHGIKRGWIK